MLEIIKKCPYGSNTPEDVFFTQACAGVDVKIPSASQAAFFSSEGIFSKHSFGVHKMWNYHSPEQLQVKENTCSGLQALRKLQ